MREQIDAEFALECLRLAHSPNDGPADVVERASQYLAFVTGDDSKDKLAAVRAIISPSAAA